MGGSYFYKNQKNRPSQILKKNILSYFISEIPNFLYMFCFVFSENAQYFVDAFL